MEKQYTPDNNHNNHKDSDWSNREKNPLPFTGLVPFKLRRRIYDFRDKVDTTSEFVEWDWNHLIKLVMDVYHMGVNEGMNQRSLSEFSGENIHEHDK